MTRRFHLSNSKHLQVKLPRANRDGAYKPAGFWYDVNLDWLRWLEGEEYLDTNNKSWMRAHLHEVWLDEGKLLKLSTPLELDNFTKTYQAVKPWPHDRDIDWPKIMIQHWGLEINPYLWQRRLTPHTFWYYGWDCAGSVIWDPSVLLSTKLMATGKNKIIEYYKQHHREEIKA